MTPDELKNYTKAIDDLRLLVENWLRTARSNGHMYRSEVTFDPNTAPVKRTVQVIQLQSEVGEQFSAFIDGIENLRNDPSAQL